MLREAHKVNARAGALSRNEFPISAYRSLTEIYLRRFGGQKNPTRLLISLVPVAGFEPATY
jgi:hypothetical protein